jgi:hypothetical protein
MLTNVVPLQQAMKHHMRPEHGTGVERGSRLSQISESLSPLGLDLFRHLVSRRAAPQNDSNRIRRAKSHSASGRKLVR